MQSYKPIDKVTFVFLQTSNQGQKCPQTVGAETLLFCMGVKLRKTCITIRKKCLTVAHVEVNFCMIWLPSQWSQVIDLRNVFYFFKHDASFFQVNRLTGINSPWLPRTPYLPATTNQWIIRIRLVLKKQKLLFYTFRHRTQLRSEHFSPTKTFYDEIQ